MNFLKYSVLIFLLLITVAQDQSDETIFPEWPEGYSSKFKSYSGFLDVDITRSLHYVFLESQSNPLTDPVVLWLNGGPGCSSLVGMIQELGPYLLMTGDTQFNENPYSWNMKANVIFLEAPAGVGYSGNTDTAYIHTDEKTGADNAKAIQLWFSKFIAYKNREFFIAGESYGGMYVPYTANALIQANLFAETDKMINLQGVLIGNGVMNVDESFRLESQVRFYANRNFCDSLTKQILLNQCKLDKNSLVCQKAYKNYEEVISSINPYGVYSVCLDDSTDPIIKSSFTQTRYSYTPGIQALKNQDAPCLDFGPVNNYFNKAEVKKAMHITSDTVFETCKDINYVRNPKGSYALLKNINEAKVRILVYSGDQDAAVSIQETLDTFRLLNLKTLQSWTPWTGKDGLVNGWNVEYDILTLSVIRAAGHMVPQDQPASAYQMFDKFIHPTA